MEIVFHFSGSAQEHAAHSRQGYRGARRKKLLALSLALTLPLLRVSRALGAEDEVGYRKSYYQEDDNRISVSTDVWRFDVGLKDNVRVEGEVVVMRSPGPRRWARPRRISGPSPPTPTSITRPTRALTTTFIIQ